MSNFLILRRICFWLTDKMKKPWQHLNSRKDEETEIELHIAGATVRLENPFEDLIIPRNSEELPEKFVKKWVIPFYMTSFSHLSKETQKDFIDIFQQIDSEIVTKLLGDFNWRTRIVGAYFAALKDLTEFEEIIGNHLLKSEVCYAGSGYCLALANFGTEESKNFLKRYLDYYLKRKDLWFDQSDAMAALYWLNKQEAEKYEPLWREFIADKPYWNLKSSKENFAKSMENIKKIKEN